MWKRIEVYQILGKDSRSHFIERKTSKEVYVLREKLTKIQSATKPKNLWQFGPQWEKPLRRERKARMGKREAKTRQCSKIETHLFHLSGRWNARTKLDVPMEAAMSCKKGTNKPFGFQENEAKNCESNKIPKAKHTCIVEVHETTYGIISTARSS